MNKIVSGIMGFEEITGGGLVSGEMCVISGATGTGKTVFGITFLAAGLRHRKNTVFISIGKSKKYILNYFSSFVFDVESFMKNLLVLEVSSLEEVLKAENLKKIHDHDPARIFVDALPEESTSPDKEKNVIDALVSSGKASLLVVASENAAKRINRYAKTVLAFGTAESEEQLINTVVVLKNEGKVFERLTYRTSIIKEGFVVKEALDNISGYAREKIKKIPIVFVSAGMSVEARKSAEYLKANVARLKTYIDLQVYHNEISADNISAAPEQINILAQPLCRLNEFANRDLLFDLNNLDGGPISMSILDEFLPPFIKDGKLLGLPSNVEIGLIFYNKKLMEKYKFSIPGTIWEMVSQCKYVGEREKNISPLLFRDVEANFSFGRIILEYISVFKGKVYDPEGNVVFNSKENAAAVQFIDDLFRLHKISEYRKEEDTKYYIDRVLEGKYFMAHLTTDMFVAQRNSLLKDKDIAFFKIPGGKCTVDAGFYSVPARAKHKETTAVVLQTFMHIDVVRDMYKKNLGFDLVPNKEFYDNTKNTFYSNVKDFLKESTWVSELENPKQTIEIIGTGIRKLILDGKGEVQKTLQDITEKLKKIGESKYYDRLMSETEKYISANLKTAGIKDTAAILNYSPDHFGRLFKEKKGLTFSEYVTDVRIKQAAALLKTEFRKSISEIAAECGYGDKNHFTKLFKKRYTLTPSEYRLKNQ